MGQGVTVLVILARETFDVVFAGRNWAFFRPFWLVGEHVRFQVSEHTATVGMGAATLPVSLFVTLDAAEGGTAL